MQSSLTKFQGRSNASDDQLKDMRVAAWHKQGVLVINPDEPKLNEIERMYLNTIGAKLYGARR